MATRDVRELLHRPIVVAPMGAGPSTPELVVAAAAAGALGLLAAGYMNVEAMQAEIAATKGATSAPFGVNVFVAGVAATDTGAITRYAESLAADAAVVGAGLGAPAWDDDHYDEKVTALLGDPPALVSFTFGCPTTSVITAFQDAGSIVAVTVTDPDEARIAAAAGADALCVQSHEAGAHRGSFANGPAAGSELPLIELVREVASVTHLPQLAAGGIADPQDVAAALGAGAVAVLCGTAFLRCRESGAHPVYKAALVDPQYTATAVTRAFSGRPARGLVNQFMRDHADAPAAYPEINNLTRPLRAAAAANGDSERMSLWAGTGHASARDQAAGEIIEYLAGA